jgi:predicted glycosyltransferase involved in capsule biosynthesis
MKVDLKNTTFIIPIRIESADRMRNVITILCYLLEKFDTNVILKEVDTESIFKRDVLPQIEEYLGDSIKNLTHIFEQSEDPVFYRMKILNEMVDMANTPIIVNYDGDVLLKSETCEESVKMILDGYDIVYPYGFGQYQKMVFADDTDVSSFISSDFSFDVLDKKSKIFDAQYGHVQFLNRKSYFAVGLENENFRGSSPEDKERFYRFEKLGYNIGRIDHEVYHLEHSRGHNSWPNSVNGNPYMAENFAVWESLQKMSAQELKKYYSNQEYMKKYVCI